MNVYTYVQRGDAQSRGKIIDVLISIRADVHVLHAADSELDADKGRQPILQGPFPISW